MQYNVCMSYYATICSYFISSFMCHLYIQPPHYCMFIALVFFCTYLCRLIVSVTNAFVVLLSTINKHISYSYSYSYSWFEWIGVSTLVLPRSLQSKMCWNEAIIAVVKSNGHHKPNPKLHVFYWTNFQTSYKILSKSDITQLQNHNSSTHFVRWYIQTQTRRTHIGSCVPRV